MVVMHTRWHLDDIIGRLTEGEDTKEDWVYYEDWLKGKRAKWVRLTLPAVASNDESYRKQGEALWPTQYSLTELADIQKTLGPYEWNSLYQQTPVDDSLREFKASWYKRIDEELVQMMNCRRFLTVDTALSKKVSSDNTGFCDNRVNSENFWHLKAWRVKLGPEELVDTLFTLHALNRYEKIGIEKTAYTDGLKPYLDEEQRKRGVFLPIVELKHNQTSKEVRIRALIPRYASGSIFHIRNECGHLETEQASFPVGAHDDVLDATAYQDQLEIKPTQRRVSSNTSAVRGKGLYGV
jgi:phage terminase large subunit-like protein